MNTNRDAQDALNALSPTARRKVTDAAQKVLVLTLHRLMNIRIPTDPALNNKVYKRLKPGFIQMWSHIQVSNGVGNEAAQSFAMQLVEKYGPSIKPYALNFYKKLLEAKRRQNAKRSSFGVE